MLADTLSYGIAMPLPTRDIPNRTKVHVLANRAFAFHQHNKCGREWVAFCGVLDNICIYDYSGSPFFNVISLDQPEVRLCLDILHFQCSIQNIGVTMLPASVLK